MKAFDIQSKCDKVNPEILMEITHKTVAKDNNMIFKGQKCNAIARKSYISVRVVDNCNRLAFILRKMEFHITFI